MAKVSGLSSVLASGEDQSDTPYRVSSAAVASASEEIIDMHTPFRVAAAAIIFVSEDVPRKIDARRSVSAHYMIR